MLHWVKIGLSLQVQVRNKQRLQQTMKNVRYHANGSLDWLISGLQSINPSREPISIPSRKYKRFTFVHPVCVSFKM